jgi:hypothetical protein
MNEAARLLPADLCFKESIPFEALSRVRYRARDNRPQCVRSLMSANMMEAQPVRTFEPKADSERRSPTAVAAKRPRNAVKDKLTTEKAAWSRRHPPMLSYQVF